MSLSKEADLKFYAKLIQTKSDKVLRGIILAYLLTQLDILCMEHRIPIDSYQSLQLDAFRTEYF